MSRFRRTTERARRLWVGLRFNPHTERVGAARRDEDAADVPDSADGLPSAVGESDDGMLERRYVPVGLTIGAAWSWRLIVIAAAIFGVFYLLGQVTMVVIPLAISFLLAAMLQPIAGWMIARGWNKSLASILVLVAGLGVVGAVLTFVVEQFIAGVPNFYDQIVTGLEQAQEWLESGPWGLDGEAMAEFLATAQSQIVEWFRTNQDTLVQNGLDIAGATATGLGSFFTGLFLVLFTTYFFMRDGRKIWQFLTGMMPPAARKPMRYAGVAGWSTLVQYMRTTIIVAAVDAVAIGFGLWILDIPLWLPLTTLVFLGGFIPIVGATVSGALAVVVALVGTDNGLVNALLVLIIVLGVQQLESNLLQPFLMSRAVKLHPLAIVLAVTGGGFTFGILGALIAVPMLAIINGTAVALNRFHALQREAEVVERIEGETEGETPAETEEEPVEPR